MTNTWLGQRAWGEARAGGRGSQAPGLLAGADAGGDQPAEKEGWGLARSPWARAACAPRSQAWTCRTCTRGGRALPLRSLPPAPEQRAPPEAVLPPPRGGRPRLPAHASPSRTISRACCSLPPALAPQLSPSGGLAPSGLPRPACLSVSLNAIRNWVWPVMKNKMAPSFCEAGWGSCGEDALVRDPEAHRPRTCRSWF